mmetsp:Transcript_9924/g.22149  ORF Transcript_9924/g.22149 Transcript_9924/m.22149 type:complete len:80 (-) Transcript_9924:279-518(-)
MAHAANETAGRRPYLLGRCKVQGPWFNIASVGASLEGLSSRSLYTRADVERYLGTAVLGYDALPLPFIIEILSMERCCS